MEQHEKDHRQTSALGFLIVGLQLIFIALKLIGTITWSWLWVLAPTWIYIGLVLTIYFVLLLIAVIMDLIKG